jgi:hypothetical protein
MKNGLSFLVKPKGRNAKRVSRIDCCYSHEENADSASQFRTLELNNPLQKSWSHRQHAVTLCNLKLFTLQNKWDARLIESLRHMQLMVT